MNKYPILVNILDKICNDAPKGFSRYHPERNDSASEDIYLEKKNQARSRALIHLYLLVSFGILDFEEREHFITDNAYDGGIDAYYIHSETKTIYFIQSKFRTSEKNFKYKNILLEEILAMDINRILDGEIQDEDGNEYNGKIKQLIREVANTEDIGRYRYKVVIMANLQNIPDSKLRTLTGGFPAEIFDYEKCYQRLVFPVVSGTYFNASDLSIFIDLSNKNAGTKISYSVKTQYKDCEITVLFVPTIEIAKILYKYKNAILKFNPRSYLEFEGRKVNESIKSSILSRETNEFALFNNGITMLSDETFINEKIGQKNKAHLTVKNPQIINGGQTAYTLSKIYENKLNDNVESLFREKEVLLKIITFIEDDEDVNNEKKFELIDEISKATNRQTEVSGADRLSNDKIHYIIQKKLFELYGIFYERKKGEFSDGLSSQYIKAENILERNLFFRLYYCSQGKFGAASSNKLFQNSNLSLDAVEDAQRLNKFYFIYECHKQFSVLRNTKSYLKSDRYYQQMYAMLVKCYTPKLSNIDQVIASNMVDFFKEWEMFEQHINEKITSLIETANLTNRNIFMAGQIRGRNSYYFIEELRKYFQKRQVDQQ